MQIIITRDAKDNYYTVRSGDRYQDGLCWDEMIGVVIRATFHGEGVEKALRTAEEHARNSYSTLGNERRRDASYQALCGIRTRIIAKAVDQFAGNVEQRLIYLLAAVQAADSEPLFADDEAPPPAEPISERDEAIAREPEAADEIQPAAMPEAARPAAMSPPAEEPLPI